MQQGHELCGEASSQQGPCAYGLVEKKPAGGSNYDSQANQNLTWDYFVKHLRGEEPPDDFVIRQPR